MATSDDLPLVIEETQIDLEERTGPSPWLVLGIIGVILAVVFGLRGASKRRRAKSEAIPTDIGGIGDSAFDLNRGGGAS